MNTTVTRNLMIAKCRNGHTVKATAVEVGAAGGCYITCPCGSRGVARSMNITIKADKDCNGVCMGAQGPSCSCSCGGENHGAHHSL